MSTRYVWEKWNRNSNVVYGYNYNNQSSVGYSGSTQFSTITGTLVAGNSFTFNKNNGNFSINNSVTIRLGPD